MCFVDLKAVVCGSWQHEDDGMAEDRWIIVQYAIKLLFGQYAPKSQAHVLLGILTLFCKPRVPIILSTAIKLLQKVMSIFSAAGT